MTAVDDLPALFDTHCHLDNGAFDDDREKVLAGARALGVQHLLIPGVRAAGWQPLLDFCRQHPGLYCALGLHPVYVRQHRDDDLHMLERALASAAPAAIGEIGLDYKMGDADPQRQQHFFEAQLAIARSANLPVILHVRKAHDKALATLKQSRVPGGIVHAFNGSLPQARHYMDLGFKFGFGGMLTFDRSVRLRRLAQELPLTDLVLETDAPDMTVVQHRGERNSPEYLPYCLAALSQVRGESPSAIATQVTENAMTVLRLTA